jgi:hypothetical protein
MARGPAHAGPGRRRGIRWRELELSAQPIAELAERRFEATRVALLGTVRRDGSPRISPVEPYLSEGDLLFGVMSRSLKAGDLRRDPRCVLHGAVTAPDAGEADVKLYGRAIEAPADVRAACLDGWWRSHPDVAVVFTLSVVQATAIEWDLDRGAMTIRRWSARRGLTQTTRSYP